MTGNTTHIAPVGNWRLRAACRGEDADLFFTDAGQTAEAGKRICARCPVQPDCLTHALTTPERFGTWGGKSQDELQNLKRGRRTPQHRTVCGTPAGYQQHTLNGERPCRGCLVSHSRNTTSRAL